MMKVETIFLSRRISRLQFFAARNSDALLLAVMSGMDAAVKRLQPAWECLEWREWNDCSGNCLQIDRAYGPPAAEGSD